MPEAHFQRIKELCCQAFESFSPLDDKKRKVDIGLWESIPESALYIPLDLHVSGVARKLGLLERKQNDWKAVREPHQTITDTFEFVDPDLPPISYMPGVDLITEGILTLTKVLDLLKTYRQDYLYLKGPAH